MDTAKQDDKDLTGPKGRQRSTSFQVAREEAWHLAKLMASSDLVPKDFREKPANVLLAVQLGHEVGLTPMQAVQNIAVINGRPVIWGDALLGIVQNSGLLQDITEEVDDTRSPLHC